jgi:hypothetical protein
VTKARYESYEEFGTTEDDELMDFIWAGISYLTRYLEFTTLSDIKSFITSGARTIYPYISDIRKQAFKAKAVTSEEVKAKIRLFTTIWAFAWIIQIITNKAGAKSKAINEPLIYYKGAKGASPAELIKITASQIISLRNTSIQYLPNITIETVRAKLIDAYKILRGVTFVSVEEYSSRDFLLDLRTDPIAGYFRDMLVII